MCVTISKKKNQLQQEIMLFKKRLPGARKKITKSKWSVMGLFYMYVCVCVWHYLNVTLSYEHNCCGNLLLHVSLNFLFLKYATLWKEKKLACITASAALTLLPCGHAAPFQERSRTVPVLSSSEYGRRPAPTLYFTERQYARVACIKSEIYMKNGILWSVEEGYGSVRPS